MRTSLHPTQWQRTGWIAITAALAGCLFTAPVFPTVLLGDWGGDQGSLNADSTHVSVAFMCTTVSVGGPVVFDATHAFDVRGYETNEGGPIRFPADSEAVELLGVLGPLSAPLTLDLTLWVLDSTGARTGSQTTMTVQQGVQGAEYACPLEAAAKRGSR